MEIQQPNLASHRDDLEFMCEEAYPGFVVVVLFYLLTEGYVTYNNLLPVSI